MKISVKSGIIFAVICILTFAEPIGSAQTPALEPSNPAVSAQPQAASPATADSTKTQPPSASSVTGISGMPQSSLKQKQPSTTSGETVVPKTSAVGNTAVIPSWNVQAQPPAQSAAGSALKPSSSSVAPMPGQRVQNPAIGPPPVPSPSPMSAGPMQIPQPPISSFREAGKSMFNLNFDDVDIYSIIHTVFGDILKVNYIIDPRVKGRATFKSVSRISQENILPVMEVILRLNGVAVVEEENLYRILPISEIAREPSPVGFGRDGSGIVVKGKALLQVIPISNVQSTDMVRLISPFLSVNASVVDVPKINALVVVDTDTNVKRLLKLIDIFDSELQKQKGPQVFVYQIQHSKSKDIAALLQQIFLSSRPGDKNLPKAAIQQATKGPSSLPATTMTPSSKSAPTAYVPPSQPQISLSSGNEAIISENVKILHDEEKNSVIILGTPEDFKVIQEAILKLDTIPRQVLIEGMIAEISLTDKLSFGLRWALDKNLFGTAFSIAHNSATKTTGSGLDIVGTDPSGNIQVLITSLATDSKAKLLASPHITVADNREARIQVGQSVPIVTSETTAVSTTGSTSQTIQYKDIGIILKVKPQISDSGQVTLDLSQEVSTYSTITLYSNETQIILNKTEASTSLVVHDGQTIVIGGLIREDRSGSKSGIPFFSKIPYLGYLFGNSEHEVKRNELVILLTPRVVKNQADAAALTSRYVDKYTKPGGQSEFNKEDLLKEPVNNDLKK